jgi:hypothetical protein
MRIRTLVRAVSITAAALLLAASPLAAQTAARPSPPRERGFIALNGGVQAAGSSGSEHFSYDVHAEAAQVDVDSPGKAPVLVDGTVGLRLWKSAGIAVGFSRGSSDAAAHVEADIPHPFFDDQPRHVSGDTGALANTETATHVQVYVLKASGRWRIRLSGGGSYFRVERDTVTAVNVDESFPFDTATFRNVTTERASGSGPGFNAAADLSWMLTRRVGVGALVRFTRGSVELNAGADRNVSVDAGGLQVGGGFRFVF